MGKKVRGSKRSPLRLLFKLATLGGLAYAASRFIARKKGEYAGLTESEARDKLIDKVKDKVGDDTAADIADKVIPKLIARGLVRPDPVSAKVDAVGDDAEEAGDEVTEAVDSILEGDKGN